MSRRASILQVVDLLGSGAFAGKRLLRYQDVIEPSSNNVLTVLLDRYERVRSTSSAVRAFRNLRRDLASQPLQVSLACARALEQRDDFSGGIALLEWLLGLTPESPDIRYELGEFLRRNGEFARAESLLRPLADDAHESAAEAVAAILQVQGKLTAASEMMARLLKSETSDPDKTLSRITFIDQCQRPQLAYQLCQHALAKRSDDVALHALAGRIALSLGRLETSREHYLAALNAPGAPNTPVLLHALSAVQRYNDKVHHDFVRFRSFLSTPQLSPTARASALFALGKALDDIGNYPDAAKAFREGNTLIRSTLTWSRGIWANYVNDRISKALYPPAKLGIEFVPVFIVGLPRSGTTLVAERLGRHPMVRNRDELNLIPYMDKWRAQCPPEGDTSLVARMASFAAAHLRQDDAPAHWYIDKNPLNFRFLGLIHELLPSTRIIYCKRNLRDTALSIWQQFFARGDDNGYAYTFEDIAAFAAGCEQLMNHWQRVLPLPIHVLEYENLILQPQESLARLQEFLDLPAADLLSIKPAEASLISTSSAWQARQSIYTTSLARWQAYAEYIPELLASFPDDSSGA
ncbi:MAG: sulfotransferase [Nevskia sp.]|nr:sulfotransferase [Nevskia sp.]